MRRTFDYKNTTQWWHENVRLCRGYCSHIETHPLPTACISAAMQGLLLLNGLAPLQQHAHATEQGSKGFCRGCTRPAVPTDDIRTSCYCPKSYTVITTLNL